MKVAPYHLGPGKARQIAEMFGSYCSYLKLHVMMDVSQQRGLNVRIQALIIAAVLALFQVSQAATITKVKGKKVMVNTEGDDISSGDKLFAVDSNGKKKAIIKITKVKGEKALGEVTKGKAAPNMALVKGKSRGEKSAADDDGGGNLAVGAMLGYGIDSMTVKSAIGDFDTTGSSFGFDAVVDYKLVPGFYLRGNIGYESFGTEGGILPGGATGVVDITFLKTGLMGQYAFMDTATQIWAGVGFNFYSAMSSTSNLLEDVGGSGALCIAGGINIPMTSSMFVPIQAEYNMFMGQEEADISIIAIRAGLMFRF